MKKLIAALRRSPKRFTLLAVVAAVLIIPAALHAWGPDRTTYTIENPADHVTFNSITDNPAYGDERQFVQIKQADQPNSSYSTSASLEAGKQYQVYVYYHNNAASNLNDAAHNYRGVANGAYMKAALPATVTGDTKATAYVGASNATPSQVYADLDLKSANGSPVALRYVSGSATIHNNGATNGATLPDSLITSGTSLGFDSLNGVVPGCNHYSGYVTFKFTADQPNFTITKQVREQGTTAWQKSTDVQPGKTVEYKIAYNNTGTTTQNNVVIKDALPAGLTYVAGSTVLVNPANPNGKTVSDDITTGGINIGNYNAGSNAFLRFSAKVPDESSLPCNVAQKYTNTVSAITNNGTKQDTADVSTTRSCEQPTPTYTCDALTVTKLEHTKFQFDTKYTVSNATFKYVTYVVTDASGKELYRGTNATYVQTLAGTYTVKAYVTVSANNTDKTVTSGTCAKDFTVEKEVPPTNPGVSITKTVDGQKNEQVAVGKEFTYQLVVKNTGDTDLTNVAVTDQTPDGVTLISADKGTISNNQWSYTIPSLAKGATASFAIKAKVATYKAGNLVNTACVNAPEVNPDEPNKSDDCDTATVVVTPPADNCPIPGKENLPKDDKDCSTPVPTTPTTTTPTTPSELPQTGISNGVVALAGLGSLVGSVAYYVISRRRLLGL